MLRMFCLLCLSFSLAALEVGDGDTSYLDTTIRPNWRLNTLHEAHEEVQKKIRIVLDASPSVRGFYESKLLFVARSNMTIRECLERLEQTNGIHYRAEALRLYAQSEEEYIESQRRHYQVNVDEFLVGGNWHAQRDFTMRNHTSAAQAGSESASLFADAPEEGIDDEYAFDKLERFLDDEDGVDFLQHVFLRASPKEFELIRAELMRQYAMETRHADFQFTFGTLDKNINIPYAFVTEAEADKVITQLQDRQALQCVPFAGQQVSAEQIMQQRFLSDLDMHTGSNGVSKLDPAVDTFVSGRSVNVRYLAGHKKRLLHVHALWTDLIDMRKTSFLQPSHVATPFMEISGDADDGTAVKVAAKPQLVDGIQSFIELPLFHQWYPRCDIVYEGRLFYVLQALRFDKRFVLVIKENEHE